VLAKAIEFDVLICDQKTMLLGEGLGHLPQDSQPLLKGISPIDYPAALCTDEMMVVILAVYFFELVAALAVGTRNPMDKPEPPQ